MRNPACFALLFGFVLVVSCPVWGDSASDPRVQEIDQLKARIQALEAQNQEMLRALEEMKSRLTGVPPAPPAPAAAPAPAPASSLNLPKVLPMGENSTLKFYGFIRVDAIMDTNLMDRTIVPMYVRSPDPGAPAAVRARPDEGAFSVDPRLTRIGMDFDGGTPDALNYAKLTGKLETDFDTVNSGPSTESREVPRIRLAYLRLVWPNDVTFTMGQQWDVIAPLNPSVNAHSNLWNAGNLGDRRPQVTLAYEPMWGPGRLSLAGSLGQTGAVDNNDLDANNTLDGAQSGSPMIQWRTGYSLPSWVEKKNAVFGVWGHHSSETTSTAIFGENRFPSESFGGDLTLPLTERLSLKGEAWRGRNLPDVRGGIAQGVDAWGRVIGSEGGWGELGYKFSDRYTLLGGYAIDNPGGPDVLDQAGARTKNQVTYLGNRFYYGRFEFGLDYLRWQTQYKDTRDGQNDRFYFYSQFNF